MPTSRHRRIHRQIVPVLGFPDVIDTTYVRMRDFTSQPHLTDESVHQVVRTRSLDAEQLHRDGLPKPQVVRSIDFTGCSAPKKADNAVTRRKNSPGHEASVIDRSEL